MTGQIDLSWTDNSSVEDGHRIYRGTTSGSLSQYDTVGVDIVSYSDTSVTDTITYYYEVAAHNTAGESAHTAEVSQTVPLSAPSGLTVAQGTNNDELDLSWTRNDDYSGGSWDIYRSGADSPAKPGDYTNVATVSDHTVTSYTDTGLTHGKTYHYFVRRVANGQTADTGTANATTALPAATWNSLTVQSTSQIDLDWAKNDNSTAGTWEIYRSTSSGTLGSLIASPSPSTTSYSDTGLTEGTTYYYTVRRVAEDASTDSTQNNETTKPSAPSALSSSWSDQVLLSWTDNSSNEDGFRVYRTTTSSPTFPGDYTQIDDIAANSTSYEDSDVTTADTYYYAVTAYASTSESSETTDSITLEEVVTTAITDLPDVSQPSLTTNTEDQIGTSWTDVIDYGSYRVEWRRSDETAWNAGLSARSVITDADSTTNWSSGSNTTISTVDDHPTRDGTSIKGVTDSTATQGSRSVTFAPGTNDDLSGDSHIQFWYRADNTSGTHSLQLTDGSATSESVSFSSKLTADKGMLVQVDLTSYSTVNLSNIDTYTWQFDGDGSGIDKTIWIDTVKVGSDVVDETTTSLTLVDLADGQSYDVRMRSETEHVNGAWTTVNSGTTNFPGPSKPAVSSRTSTTVTITWTDNSEDEDGFRIERAKKSGGSFGSFSTVANTNPGATSYTDTGLEPDTTYKYRITAFNN